MDTTLTRVPVGQLLDGRYLVESLLARGGMATVYRGTDTRLDRAVALKIMHPELAGDEDFVRRFVAEARSVARLSHPNVVTVYDQGADGRTLYLAMEYVPGRTLRDLLAERAALRPREALDITERVLAGLAAAHAAGIAHRDVKPENVLLGDAGAAGDASAVKVADFGLARLVSGASHTKSGLLIGTAAYLAPEQVSGGRADARTDVYAAGVMLFELLTGRQPHTGDTPLAVAYKHVNEVVPAPSGLVPGLPPALDGLVALATNRDPDRRPADAGQFLRAVSGARSGLPHEITRADFPPPARDPVPDPSTADTAPPRPVYSSGHPLDFIPGMAPPPPAESFPGPGTGAPAATGQFAPGAARWGNHNTLIVTGSAGPYEPAALAGYPPAEPALQRLLFSRRLAYLAVGVVVLAAAGVLAWWLMAGRYTTVPRMAGISLATARADLRDAGLAPATGRAVPDNQVAKGLVIRTVPAGGTRLARGGRVTLIVSAGPRMLAMPQVTGQTLTGAKAAIRHAGLVPGKVKTVTSATIAAGIVISTSPGAGTRWPQPKPVTLVVSAGPPLPDFVGQQKAGAEQWAAANGVKLNEVPARSSDRPAGTVIRQSVPPGSAFSDGQVITVVFSPGPPMVTIPNVDGMRVAEAAHVLRNLGFAVQVAQVGPFDVVFNYSPQGQAPKGSTVTLDTGLPRFPG
jgi:serine/threonine-protein kinase